MAGTRRGSDWFIFRFEGVVRLEIRMNVLIFLIRHPWLFVKFFISAYRLAALERRHRNLLAENKRLRKAIEQRYLKRREHRPEVRENGV